MRGTGRMRMSSALIGGLCIAAALLVSGYIGVLSVSRSGWAPSQGGDELGSDKERARIIMSRLDERRRLRGGISADDTADSTGSDGEQRASDHLSSSHSRRQTGGRRSNSRAWKREDLEENYEDVDLVCPPCPQCSASPAVVVAAPVVEKAKELVSTAHYLHNPRRFHIVTTAAGFSNHWQIRIHYYWYKKQREACERQAVCDMGGFTRLLHTGAMDDLMDEVPTVVVDPLPKTAFGGQDDSYIVLNRPYAFVEWLSKASVPERYILMCEGDHLMMRPIPNMMNGEASAAAFFSYMVPSEYPEVIRSLVGNVSDAEIATIPRIGNSPTFISVKDMRVQGPSWYNTTMDIWKDDKAHKAWNWVLEMYGYALGTFRAGLHKGLVTSKSLLAHPPFDTTEMSPEANEPFYLLHLTYPMRFNTTGHIVNEVNQSSWHFDKRDYSEKAPPRGIAAPPPYVKNDLIRLAIAMINEATEAIPCWDEYVATKRVTTTCAPSSTEVGGATSKAVASQA